MLPMVSIVIPAWNEAKTIGITLQALCEERKATRWWHELIVIDDGSIDDTYAQAKRWADKVIVHEVNKGKGAALQSGCREASYPIVLLLDADLGTSVVQAFHLLLPIINNKAHMTIAKWPKIQKKAGFGLVKGLATHGIYKLSGYKTQAPLSGQRAIRKTMLNNISDLSHRFGVEVGLTIDAARKGYTIVEVEIPFQHRETGRNIQGFVHRGKQFIAVGKTLFDKWLHPTC